MDAWQPSPPEIAELRAYAAAHGVGVDYDSATGYLEIWTTNPDPTVTSRRHSHLVYSLLQAKIRIDEF
jgi:hypothetical protein